MGLFQNTAVATRTATVVAQSGTPTNAIPMGIPTSSLGLPLGSSVKPQILSNAAITQGGVGTRTGGATASRSLNQAASQLNPGRKTHHRKDVPIFSGSPNDSPDDWLSSFKRTCKVYELSDSDMMHNVSLGQKRNRERGTYAINLIA